MPKEFGLSKQPDGDEVFAVALGKIVSDRKLREQFDKDPVRTLEALGVAVDDKQRARLVSQRLPSAGVDTPFGIDAQLAWTKPLVKVATHGTAPVVQVAVSVGVSANVKERPLVAPMRKSALKKPKSGKTKKVQNLTG